MNKTQFERGYIRRSKITPEFYHEHFITLPCQCGVDVCKGWAAIYNTPEMIALHLEDIKWAWENLKPSKRNWLQILTGKVDYVLFSIKWHFHKH